MSISGEEKFWELSVGIENLADFLNTVLNRPPKEDVEKIRENLKTLKKFDALFKELEKYKNPLTFRRNSRRTFPERARNSSGDGGENKSIWRIQKFYVFKS